MPDLTSMGDSGKAVVVVNKIVDLALAAVVIIEQLIAVRDQLACYYAFIDRAEIDTFFHHSAQRGYCSRKWIPVSIPTSLRYSLSRFFPVDSISGKTGFEIA